MKLRALKDDDYNKLVIHIYKISNDNKMNRLYFFNLAITRLTKASFNPIYHDMLLLDLNIYDAYQEHPNNEHLSTDIDPKVEMEFNIKLHETMIKSYYI